MCRSETATSAAAPYVRELIRAWRHLEPGGLRVVSLRALARVVVGRVAVFGCCPGAEERHRGGGWRCGLDGVDVEDLVVVAECAGLVVDRHWADDRVVVALGAVVAGEDVVFGPPGAELGARDREFA